MSVRMLHLLVAAALCIATTRASATAVATKSDVTAEVAVVADAPAPTLAFTVTNVGTKAVERGGFTWTTNSISLLTPSGRVGGGHGIADDFGAAKPETIPPGGSFTWTVKVKD